MILFFLSTPFNDQFQQQACVQIAGLLQQQQRQGKNICVRKPHGKLSISYIGICVVTEGSFVFKTFDTKFTQTILPNRTFYEYFLNYNLAFKCFSENVLFLNGLFFAKVHQSLLCFVAPPKGRNAWQKFSRAHAFQALFSQRNHIWFQTEKITFTASSSSNDTYVRLVSNMSGES